MFERLSVPTPFQVGPVNAYLAGRTLVDPGPDSEASWSTLVEKLDDRGLAPEDLDRVLVTHPHPDHFGLANRLREAGAEVCASAPAAEIIGDFAGRLAAEQEFFGPFLERHGVSEETARTVTQLPEAYLEYAPDAEVDRTLSEGGTVEVQGRDVAVLAVEGHATGELAFTFRDRDGESAVVGDQVLPDITPNPLLQPPRGDGQRPRSLVLFNRSLRRLRDRGFERILPGHREVVVRPEERIDEILAAHERRTENVADLVDGPTTAVEVMEGLFGDLPATEVFPGMSEAVGHLEVLEERDRVTSEQRGGLVVYAPT